MSKSIDYVGGLVAIIMILGPLSMAPGYGTAAAGLPAHAAVPPATAPGEAHR